MAFSSALYYPQIDVPSEKWLKTAVLYWEEIRTIVPSAISRPYSASTSLELQEAGILVPLFVESSMPEIEDLTEDVESFVRSPEALQLVLKDEIDSKSYIHRNKLPANFEEIAYLHPDKISGEIRHMLEGTRLGRRNRGWYQVPSRFAEFYMTLLATRLAQLHGNALLTESFANDKLANAVRMNANLPEPLAFERLRTNRNIRHAQGSDTLAQGMLIDLVLQRITIDARTPISKLIKFRMDHAAELGRLRTKIGELSKSVSKDLPFEALQQTVHDLYVNEIIPSLTEIKEDLSAQRIRWFAENYIKIALIETGNATLLTWLGLGVPQALLAATGISMTASTILYNLDRRKLLRENPYSYVLSVEHGIH